MKVIVIGLTFTIVINLVSSNEDFEMEMAKVMRVKMDVDENRSQQK